MKTLTKKDALGWVGARGFETEVDVKPRIHFPSESPRWSMHLPHPPYRITSLANCLLPYDDEGHLEPCLVWFTDWGIWSETAERVGSRLITLLRSAHGESQPLIQTPAHVFDSSEVIDAQAFVMLALLIGWDVFVIPANGEFIAFHSHDEYIEVSSINKSVHERFRTVLQPWDAREG